MKIALVHDYLTQFGGGERVLLALCEMFPEAPIYTLIYDEKATNSVFKNKKIHASFLQRIPGAKKFFRGLIWLMPLAIEQFDLSDFDIVISVSHSYGKGIITKPGTKHVCYCLTPTRYLWHVPHLISAHAPHFLRLWRQPKSSEGHDAGLPFKPVSRFILTYLRNWDYQAAQRPDYFVACSENVKQRIKKYYGRESEVIYPPVEVAAREHPVRSFSAAPAASSEVVGRFVPPFLKNHRKGGDQAKTASESAHQTLPSGPFLMVGRLVPYKRFDIAIEAFSKLPSENLLIIGDGPERKKLEVRNKRLGAKNIKFIGKISDNELLKYYANCRALVFPQEEDFGIVPIEAMASGRPVIAYKAGGVLETVIDKETGLFFNEQNPKSLIEAIKKFEESNFYQEKIQKHAKKFNKEVFKKKISRFINNLT